VSFKNPNRLKKKKPIARKSALKPTVAHEETKVIELKKKAK
jgi:hypothetical protein